jgi:predicted nucleotidyltransferase
MKEITPEKMAAYRATARRRREEEARELKQRHRRACQVAAAASSLLKEQFGAQRVVLFGSVRFPERFHRRSDIDLAVWGLDERLYYRAVSRLIDLDSTISIDLIEAETAPSNLLAVINRDGISL